MSGFKTLMDVDMVIAVKNKSGDYVYVPLRNMYGTAAIDIFKEDHLLHLIHINSKKGIIPFHVRFKEFLSDEVKVSVRKIEYVMKVLISEGYVLKEKRVYMLTEKYKKRYKKESKTLAELPWGSQPNYQK